MGCNCGKKKVLNNLGIPSYIQMAIDVWNKVSDLSEEQITDDLWMELYMVYGNLYPNSKGQPSKPELLKTIQIATGYKKVVNKKR